MTSLLAELSPSSGIRTRWRPSNEIHALTIELRNKLVALYCATDFIEHAQMKQAAKQTQHEVLDLITQLEGQAERMQEHQ